MNILVEPSKAEEAGSPAALQVTQAISRDLRACPAEG